MAVMLTASTTKACKQCGSQFSPWSSTQTVCGRVCAGRMVRAQKKQEAERKKLDRMMDKAKREGMKTIPQLIADAQDAFNAFIRERDKDKGCFVCHRPFENVVGRVQHAGHVRSRGAAGHLRFHEDNCHGECEGCNGPHGAKPHQIKAGAIARIGQEKFDALEADNEPIKWTREALREIKTIYRAKLRELKKGA